MRDQIRQSNIKDAEDSLAQEELIESCEAEVSELQASLREFVTQYNMKLAQVEGKYSLDKSTVRSKLEVQREAVDEASESVAMDFVNGEGDMNAFMKDYIEQRTSFHALSIKLSRVG